jgi:DNA-binding CsgD family transcriptional regulator
MTQTPLTGRDAQILDLLIRVCRIGQHRGTWGTADVRRVAAKYLRPSVVATPMPPQPRSRPQHRPRPPRDDYPIPEGPPRVAALTPRQHDALQHMKAGHDPNQTAAALHCTPARAANLMSEVARACGGVDRWHVLRLVDAGAVVVHIRDRTGHSEPAGTQAEADRAALERVHELLTTWRRLLSIRSAPVGSLNAELRRCAREVTEAVNGETSVHSPDHGRRSAGGN